MSKVTLKTRTYSWQEAAHILGISRTTLLNELKSQKILTEDRQFGAIPSEESVRDGMLKTELTTHYINGAIPRHYRKTRVTIQGLAWLERILSSETANAA